MLATLANGGEFEKPKVGNGFRRSKIGGEGEGSRGSLA